MAKILRTRKGSDGQQIWVKLHWPLMITAGYQNTSIFKCLVEKLNGYAVGGKWIPDFKQIVRPHNIGNYLGMF